MNLTVSPFTLASIESERVVHREIELTPTLHRLLAAAKTGENVFHGSGRRGLTIFRRQPDGMDPLVLGRQVHFKPLVHATASPLLAAVVAASRAGGGRGFEWCTHPMKPDSAFDDRIAATFYYRDGATLEQIGAATAGKIPSTATVYGFRRSQFRSDGPIWGDYLADHDVDVDDVFPLDAADLRALVGALRIESLHAVTNHRESSASSSDAFSSPGMCSLGGHLQYRTGGDGMLEWRPLKQDERAYATSFFEIWGSRLSGAQWWGSTTRAFAEVDSVTDIGVGIQR